MSELLHLFGCLLVCVSFAAVAFSAYILCLLTWNPIKNREPKDTK